MARDEDIALSVPPFGGGEGAGPAHEDELRGGWRVILAGTAVIAAVSALCLPWPLAALSSLLGALMVAGADVDARSYILPDLVTFGALASGLLAAAVMEPLSPWLAVAAAVARAAATAGVLAAIRGVHRRLSGIEGLGLGVHGLVGLALLAAHLLAGSGVARLLLGRSAALADVLLLGFPLGMAISAALAATTLTAPHGAAFAVLVWGACSLGLLGWRANPGELRALGRVALTAAPFALSYGCWLALLWHGPTETLSGSPSGDLIYYATSISSLSSHPYPHLNLGYERVPFGSYFNMLVPAIGAALTRVAPIDPFLFIIASASSFFVLSLAITLCAFAIGAVSTDRAKFGWPTVVLWLAVLVANRYPYWTAESVPFIYTVPLTVAVAHWARKPELRAGLAALAIAIGGSALSKVVTATALGS